MDPWMMGLLAMFGAQNPGQAGALFDQVGIPPPAGAAIPGQDAGLGGLISGGGQPAAAPTGPMDAGGTAPAGPGTAPGANPQALMQLAAMQGVKAPGAPQVIQAAGVPGGVKPPEMHAGAATSPVAQTLMQALLAHSQNPLRVPALGDMIRGGKY